jgi:hypothetical protein
MSSGVLVTRGHNDLHISLIDYLIASCTMKQSPSRRDRCRRLAAAPDQWPL